MIGHRMIRPMVALAALLATPAAAQTVTADQARAALATLGAYVGASSDASTTSPYVSPLAVTPKLVIPDTTVAAGDRRARVAVTLSQAANRPLAWRCLTANGPGAYEGGFYGRTETLVRFAPGETVKVVEVPVLRDLGGGSFSLGCSWPQTNPPVPGASGIIKAGPSSSAPIVPAVTYPSVARTSGRKLAFDSTFHEPIAPTAVRGAWRSSFAWGRVQTGNGEIAPYTHASTDPGVTPHSYVDGHLVLRAEKVATVDRGQRYAYSAALIDSGPLFGFQYGYAELRVKWSRAQGTATGWWLIPVEEKWPPEIDIFETGLGDSPNLQSTIHFKHDGFGTAEGVTLPQTDADGAWHVIGFDWTKEWQVTFVDGVEVSRRRNGFHEPMKFVAQVSVGGLGPDPKNAGAGWKSEMTLDYLRVWQ